MRGLMYGLIPLTLLLLLAVCSNFIAFGILRLTGDIVPLAKLISKTTLVLLLLSIFPLKKYLQFSWFELGFAPRAVFFKQIGQGFGLALLTLLPVLLTLYWLDVHVFDGGGHWSAGKLAGKIASALALAMLIALAEESLFRGLLLTGLRRKMSVLTAVITTSVYYAALHFLKSKTQIPYEQQTASSGLRLVMEAFANWLNPEIMSALLALFVVGLFLAIIRTHLPQSLGICIGCHAGWVCQIKLSKDLFDVNSQSEYLYLVSSYDGVVGPLVSIWLAGAITLWLGLSGRNKPMLMAQ